MDRRVKAALVALSAAAIPIVAITISAMSDDQWLLRLLCAGYEKYSVQWWAFGCWALEDPPPNPMGLVALVVARFVAVV